MKEKLKPTARIFICPVEKWLAFFMRSSAVAASMVGIERRKENSTIVLRFSPIANPPTMVAADLETPGIMARD